MFTPGDSQLCPTAKSRRNCRLNRIPPPGPSGQTSCAGTQGSSDRRMTRSGNKEGTTSPSPKTHSIHSSCITLPESCIMLGLEGYSHVGRGDDDDTHNQDVKNGLSEGMPTCLRHFALFPTQWGQSGGFWSRLAGMDGNKTQRRLFQG